VKPKKRTIRGHRRVLRVVLALYSKREMRMRELGRAVAEPGEDPEVVRRVLYRMMPDLVEEGIVEWRERRVSLTPVAAESISWLLDCLDSKPCHSLLETVVRLEDEGLLGEVMRRSRASAGGGG